MSSDSDHDISGDDSMSDVESEDLSSDLDQEQAQDTIAPKRRKVEQNRGSKEALHGVGDGIDHAEDAEATLIALEVRELLQETAVSDEDFEFLHSCAADVASSIKSLKESEVNNQRIQALLANFDFPVDRKFIFQPPTDVLVIGSFALDNSATAVSQTTLDLAIRMPKSCFDEKDQLNHRYYAKRALYLSHIATSLKKKANKISWLGSDNIHWALFRGDHRRPILELTVAQKNPVNSKHHRIRLIPVAPPDLFPLSRLSPLRNNLRTPQLSQDKSSEYLPTPWYNTGILQDMLMVDISSTIVCIAEQVDNFGEACALLKVWCDRQRLYEGNDGVDGFFLTCLLAQLIECGRAVRDSNNLLQCMYVQKNP